MEIQELPDYKAHRSEIDKYLDEPLFEYIWKVADCFLPVVDYDGEISESQAPIIFANRYIESKLTSDEKYKRFIDFFPNNNIDSAKQYYEERTGLDTSFKDTFFNDEEIQNTLKAFRIDLNKFWYLLLFVNDVVIDVCTNAPSRKSSQVDKVNEMLKGISEATEVITKKNGRKNYETQDEFTLNVLQASINYFIQTYNNIVNTSDTTQECKKRLEQLGLRGMFKDWVELIYKEKVGLEKSHKTRLFAEMFQYFLKGIEVDREVVKKSKEKISTDKLLLISRLTHIIGLQGKDYYERYTEDGKENRKLSNLLNRYRNEPLPPTIGWIYSGGI